MFRESCSIIDPCLCQFCGVRNSEIVVVGTGCLLSTTHALTARHLVIDTHNRGGQPRIINRSGAFACEVVWETAESDLTLLRLTTCESEGGQPPPSSFPRLADVQPAQGMLLGYMAFLRREGGAVTRMKFFSGGFVSVVNYHTDQAMRYVLSSGFTEGGFSGGPVFRRDGTLIGVIVSAIQSWSQGLIVDTPFTLPEFVSLAQHRREVISEIN